MFQDNKAIGYATLRLAMGINFFGHGFFRILSGVGAFAGGMAETMAKGPLPAWNTPATRPLQPVCADDGRSLHHHADLRDSVRAELAGRRRTASVQLRLLLSAMAC